ncbi:hypothetical protein [Metapseudomonas sp. CR1201]
MDLTTSQATRMLIRNLETTVNLYELDLRSNCQAMSDLMETELAKRNQMLEILEQRVQTLLPQDLREDQLEQLSL